MHFARHYWATVRTCQPLEPGLTSRAVAGVSVSPPLLMRADSPDIQFLKKSAFFRLESWRNPRSVKSAGVGLDRFRIADGG